MNRKLLVFMATTVASACAVDLGNPEDGTADVGDLSAKNIEVVGALKLGQTSAPVLYTNPPLYRAFSFTSPGAVAIKAAVHTRDGDTYMGLTDASFKMLKALHATNRATDTVLRVNLPAAGTYYVVFRDYGKQRATFTVDVAGRDDALCGDGVVEPGEQCDDGNTVPGDGCSATCQVETAPGIAGTYALVSHFDLTQSLPTPFQSARQALYDLTDGPNDPATYFLDRLVETMDPTVASAITAMRPALDLYTNEVLKQYSPDAIRMLVALAHSFDSAVCRPTLKSTLKIEAASATTWVATHTVTGATIDLGSSQVDYPLPPFMASGIAVQVGADSVDIGSHVLGVPFGQLALALDALVIPALDPMASNLHELLVDLIDCHAMGDAVASYVGFGPASVYESMCQTTLANTASSVEGKLSGLGNTFGSLTLHGTANPVDGDHDGAVDQLTGGLWDGLLTFGAEVLPLPRPYQTFAGTRATP